MRLFKRTPGSFSGVPRNSIPRDSRAVFNLKSVSSRGLETIVSDSNFLRVIGANPEIFANSVDDKRNRALAALI